MADILGLSFSVIEPLMEELKVRQFFEVKRSLGYGLISSVFTLSDSGRKRARECYENNQYVGPLPVPATQYMAAVEAQKPAKGWLTSESLAKAYRHLVLGPRTLSQIGPAVNSGKSLLMYGQPGNGKTFLAEALLKPGICGRWSCRMPSNTTVRSSSSSIRSTHRADRQRG